MFNNITFPVYRKYKTNTTFIKIISPNEFDEIQLIGKKVVRNKILAKQLPELNQVYDLVFNYHTFAEVITEYAYNEIEAKLI